MADIKRNYSDIASLADLDENKKIHAQTKVGRKPIETEPKSKRTAQNRAAQRAYRERKERKMQDLEDKVKSLEDANVKALTETDFLKAQVDILKNELAKYRGGNTDLLDLNLPTKVGHLSSPNNGNYQHRSDNTPMSSISSSNSIKSPNNDKHSSASSFSNGSPGIAFENPWSKDNLQKLKGLQQQKVKVKQQYQQQNNEGCPDLVLGSSSSTSPLNDNLLVTPESLTSGSTGTNLNNNVPMNVGFSNDFDEQVDPFCALLNEACGTRKNPVPKYKRSNSKSNTTSNSHASPFSNLVTPDGNGNGNESITNTADYMNDPFFSSMATDYNFNFDDKKLSGQYQDPLSFLNDNNFDVALAFGDPSPDQEQEQEQDPIALLTTEESIYDPITDNSVKVEDVNTNFNFNDFIKSSLPEKHNKLLTFNNNNINSINSGVGRDNQNNDDNDNDNEVVPAPEQTMKCSEIWDRITAHPKYTEIDIDGLCLELKRKAKCSERGVVINTTDVNQILQQSIKR